MVTLRPFTVDDLSTARYIHTASFTGAAAEHYAPDDIAAFVAFVRSPLYGDLLLGNHAVAAWIGAEMVGTAAWSPGEGLSPTARILALCVRPLFTGEGIGRQLLDHIERRPAPPASARSRWRLDAQRRRLLREPRLSPRAQRRLGAAVGVRDSRRLYAQGRFRRACTPCADARL